MHCLRHPPTFDGYIACVFSYTRLIAGVPQYINEPPVTGNIPAIWATLLGRWFPQTVID